MAVYPIAEIFHSIQGEGFWCGTPMLFIRLAGCNVGSYEERKGGENFPIINPDYTLYREKKHSICTTFDGQRFLCDTDYHSSAKYTVEMICASLEGEEHVCITGGEPLMHDLNPLVDELLDNTTCDMVHIETSGTKPIPPTLDNSSQVWITCCPKEGANLDIRADEWKLLIGPNSAVDIPKFLSLSENIYLQPINSVNEVDSANLQRVFDLLKRHPQCKLSAQLHKYLKVR